MNIVLCSAFRNAEAYVERYFDQVSALDRLITRRGDVLSLVLGYGDSTDSTDALLFEQTSGNMLGTRLIDVSHGGPVYGSIADARRFKQLAYVANRIFVCVPDDADAILWIESDLIWEPATIVELLNHLQWRACVAPAVMEQSTGGFYDTWAFRKDGLNFQKYAPFHPNLRPGLNKMDSVGSCVAITVPEFYQLTVPEENVIVGVCEQIKKLGGGVWCDMDLTVWHP